MVKARRFDFYPDDWLAGTMSLSIEERGVYITVISAIYSAQKAVKISDIRALCPMHGNSFNSILLALVKSGKLSRKGDEIHSNRCRNEIEKALKRVRKASENGAKGGRVSTKSETYEKRPVSKSESSRARLPSPSPPPPPIDTEGRTSVSVERAGARGTHKNSPSLGGSNAGKSSISTDWQPDITDCEHAARRGWDRRRIEQEAENFRDFCLREGKLYADWNAGWRSWCKIADERGARPNGPPARSPPRSRGSLAEAARSVLARHNLDDKRC